MQTQINVADLTKVTQEAATLTSKRSKWSTQDEKRYGFLLAAMSAIKAGASLAQLEQDNHNEESIRSGLPVTNFKRPGLTVEQEIEARGWDAFLKHSPAKGEHRDMTEGAASAISRIGTYTGLGYFVATDFFNDVIASMAAHDFLFDPESVTFIRSTNGAPLPVPVASDIENVATLTGEAGSLTSTDIASTGHVTLGSYSFSSPRFVASIEAEQDLNGTLSVRNLFKRFAADRLARGIGKYLINGNGSGQPLGLLQALANLNVQFIIAAGSSANDGSAATGANSLGVNDFANAFDSLDAAYLASDKVAWAMNIKTFGKLLQLTDKQGRPLIDFADGTRTLMGIPIKIAPSLPNIGASNTPVVLGDWSYFVTRYIFDEGTGIAVFREAPGLIENGNVGLKVFARADCNILWEDTNSPCPFVPITNHS